MGNFILFSVNEGGFDCEVIGLGQCTLVPTSAKEEYIRKEFPIKLWTSHFG